MSSSVVIDRTEDKKNDDTLVIIVNADGTLSVDPKTLQKVLASQQNAPVSVLQCVDNGQPAAEEENENGLKVNLVVEGYFPQNSNAPSSASVGAGTATAPNPVVGSADENPFLEMDPEELARLETALQSEEAKQILGENVAAMLDDLNVSNKAEKDAIDIHSSIQFDHCYTSLCPPKSVSAASESRQSINQINKAKGGFKQLTAGSISNLQPNLISKSQHGAKLIPVIKPLQMSSVRSNVSLQNSTYVVAQKKGAKNTGTLQKVLMKQIAPSATQVAAVSSTGEIQRILSPNKQSPTGVTSSQPSNNVIVNSLQPSESHAVIKNLAANQKAGNRKLVRIVPPDLKKPGVKYFAKLAPGQDLSAQNISFSVLSPSKSAQSLLKPQQQVADADGKFAKVKIGKQGVKIRKQDEKLVGTIEDKLKKILKDPKEMQSKKLPQNKGGIMEGVAFVSSSGGPVEVKTNLETKQATSGKKQLPKVAPAPRVVGPELFSAPDIIRRISTDQIQTKPDDKNLENAEALMAKLHEPNYEADTISVTNDGTVMQLQDMQEDIPVVDSSTGFDLNSLPVVFASSPEPMISKPSQISKGPGAKSVSLKQATLTNNLRVMTPKTGEKIFAARSNQSALNPDLSLQVESNISNVAPEKQLLMHNQPFDPATPGKKLPTVELPATRGSSRKINPNRKDDMFIDGSEFDDDVNINIKPSPSPKKAGGATKKLEKKKFNEARKNAASRAVTDENLDNVEIAAVLDDDMPSEDDQSWNSEDDPDRLWCICKKPHNNRFMICCDTCEEWFHGKCVGITKAMGEQMEEKGIEWACPTCRKKKEQGTLPMSKEIKKTPELADPRKVISKRKSVAEVTSTNSGEPPPKVNKLSSLEPQFDPPKLCIICEKKEIRFDGVYCSDECIDAHIKDYTNILEKIEKGTPLKMNTRVTVMERNTGRVNLAANAPTIADLKLWLTMHPTFEIIKPCDPSTKANPKQIKEHKYQIPKLPSKQGKDVASAIVISAGLPSGSAVSSAVPTAAVSPTTPTAPNSSLSTIPTSGTGQTSTKQHVAIRQGTKTVGLVSVIPAKPQTPLPAKTLKQQTLHITSTGNVKTSSTTPVATKTPVSTPSSSKSAVKTPGSTPALKGSPTVSSTPVSSKVSAKRLSAKDTKPSEPKEKTPKLAKKIESKKSESNLSKRVSEDTPATPKAPDSEPVRKNVRKMLQEALLARIRDCSDLQLSEEEIASLTHEIEEELYNFFKEAGVKYKSKSRSLVFNIKDPKNLTLFRKIADKSFSPQQVARLSAEEMASQELAQWRERENKHQLDMIKKNELDLLASSKTLVLKTHKGDMEIESTESRKEVSVEDFVPDLNESEEIAEPKTNIKLSALKLDDSKKESEKDKESSKDKHKSSRRHESSRHSSSSSGSSRHRRSKRHKTDRDKDKEKEKEKEKEKKSSDKKRNDRSSSSRDSHSRKKSSEKSSDSKKSSRDDAKHKSDFESGMKVSSDIKSSEEDDIVKLLSDKIMKESEAYDPAQPTGMKDFDSDISDREPSSTVIINTPPFEEEQPPLWKGLLSMTDVAKFCAAFQPVSGNCVNLGDDVPSTIECVGRINPATVWEYIGKVKKSGTKDIIVIRFTPENDEEQVAYLSLYAYLSNKNRMAVVGHLPINIKDFYVLPLADHSPIPQVLLPLDGPGFEDIRPHLLLGIIVKHKSDFQLASWDSTSYDKKELRSYTPPPTSQVIAGSLTPPYPPPSDGSSAPAKKAKYDDSNISPVLNAFDGDDDSPYSPGEEEPYSPGDNDDGPVDSAEGELQKQIDEFNKKIEDEKKQIQSSLFGSKDPVAEQVLGEELYSPTGSVSPPRATISFYGSSAKTISLPPNLQEILESIKKPNKQGSSTTAAASNPLDINLDPIIKAYSKCQTPPDDGMDDKRGIEEIIPHPSSDEEYDSMDEEALESGAIIDAPKLSRDPRQRRDAQPQMMDEELINSMIGVGYSTEGLSEDPTTSQSAPPMIDVSMPPPPLMGFPTPFPPFAAFPPAPGFPPQPPGFLAPVPMPPMVPPLPPVVSQVAPTPLLPTGASIPFPPPAPPAPPSLASPLLPPAPLLSGPSEPSSSSNNETRNKGKFDRASDNRQDREYRTRNKNNGNNSNSSGSNYGNYRKDDHSSYQNTSRSRDRYENRDRFRQPHNQFWRGGRGSKSRFGNNSRPPRDEYDADIKHFEKEQRERTEQLRKIEERRKKAL